MTKLYLVVSNKYVRNDGEGYESFEATTNLYDCGPDLAHVAAEYIVTYLAYQRYLAGRIPRGDRRELSLS